MMSYFILLIITIFEYNFVKIILIRLSINYFYGPKFCCLSKLSLKEEINVSKLWIATREKERATMHGTLFGRTAKCRVRFFPQFAGMNIL